MFICFLVQDISEAVLQFKELPSEYTKDFVEKIVTYVLDAKKSDLELTIKLFKQLVSESVVSKEVFKAGFVQLCSGVLPYLQC